jgi:hypothetical protein
MSDYDRLFRLFDEAMGALKTLADEADVKGETYAAKLVDEMVGILIAARRSVEGDDD